jgi:hypothetical protein
MVLAPGMAMMPGTPHLLAPAPSERPPCPLCGTPMWVVRIEPLRPDANLRTLECPKCQYVEAVAVERR